MPTDEWLENPLLGPHTKLHDFTKEEWRILREGAPEPLKIGTRSTGTGRVDMVGMPTSIEETQLVSRMSIQALAGYRGDQRPRRAWGVGF